jgi:hypothetical protein
MFQVVISHPALSDVQGILHDDVRMGDVQIAEGNSDTVVTIDREGDLETLLTGLIDRNIFPFAVSLLS